MIFEWDPAKAAKNQQKHRVSFEEAATVFLDPGARTYQDPDHSNEEDREITIGISGAARLLFVSHCERRGRVRIISARRATRHERSQHEQSKKR